MKLKSKVKRPRGCWKPRKCTLQNVKTGVVVTAKSIAEFCRKQKIKNSIMRHIPDVLDGKTPHSGGWFRPQTLKRRLELRDIYGNRYSTTTREILNSKELSNRAINRLIEGRTVAGLFDATKDISHTLPPRTYKATGYVFQDETGERFEGETIKEVAEKSGIDYGSAVALVHGYRDRVSGVYLKRVKTVQRQALSL